MKRNEIPANIFLKNEGDELFFKIKGHEVGRANNVWMFRILNNKYILKRIYDTSRYEREKYGWLKVKAKEGYFFCDKEQYAIFPFIEGAPVTKPDKHKINQIAYNLAILHKSSIKIDAEDFKINNSQPCLIMDLLMTKGWKGSGLICYLHGDVCLQNSLFDKNGKFITFIDFEESSWGDPIIDLAISIIECCLSDVNSNEEALDLYGKFINNYMKTFSNTKLLDLIENRKLWSMCLFETLFVLKNWALQNNQKELLYRYIRVEKILSDILLNTMNYIEI